jgi:hypothetical protein
MSSGSLRFEDVIGLWQDGLRRLAEAEPGDRPLLDRVVEALVAELRRRLGGQFSVQELARLYAEQGTDWCFQIAIRLAPGNPSAWDMPTVAGSAFARYAREASDYAIGRRIVDG